MPRIAGYHDLQLLLEGEKSTVIRARRDTDNLPVIIKQVSHNTLIEAHIGRLRHEYQLLTDLNIPGVIRPLAHHNSDCQPYTLFHDPGGIPLSRYITDQPHDWQTLLPVMRGMCDRLGAIHQAGIIHKQITPDNILIDPASGRLVLIDFTLATRLASEQAPPDSTLLPAGALPYMAPEQSGRINRKIDYRTDFYGLGATFYHLLTGRPPFTASDRLELIHSHIARHPQPLERIRPDIPEMLSHIVLKLIAKDAAQRYQSIFGVAHDLERCIQQQSQDTIDPFPIAQQDHSERFILPQRLYGRGEILSNLFNLYQRAAGGQRQTVLITGYAGIGKSTLVNEIRDVVLQRKGVMTSGKFDQFSRSQPYSAIIYALQSLIRQLLTETESDIVQWRSRIQGELGDNASLMTRLIPELALIIGQPTTPRQLSKYQEQNLISRMFVRLMEVFSVPERPLVLFLDDLQWGDLASLNLIETLAGSPSLSHLMLVLSYRDQEVGPAHPLQALIRQLRLDDGGPEEITLQPLNQPQIAELLADTLHREAGTVMSLARICLRKTQGNPFFLKQFLTSLHERRLIRFEQGRWIWDEARINGQELAEDVITLLVTRIEKLPEDTQRMLKLAACIGGRFDLKTLSIVNHREQDAPARALWPALKDGLITPLDEHVPAVAPDGTEQTWYRFVHDRVQQAAYSLVPQEERKQLHLKIGQLLWDDNRQTLSAGNIFDITNHLNLARDVIQTREERTRLAELNLQAGTKARESAAYDEAAAYFQHGLDLLPDDAWEDHYPLCLALHTEAAEVAFSRSNFAGMEQLIERVLSRTRTLNDRLRINELQIQAATAQNRFDDALSIALGVLALLGIHFPESPGKLQIRLALMKIQHKLKRHAGEKLLTSDRIRDDRVRAALPILTSMFGIVKFSSSALRPLVMAKQVELTLDHGIMPCSAQSLAGYGGTLCGYYGDIDRGYEIGRLALELDRRQPGMAAQHKTLFLHYTYIDHWKQPLDETLEPLLQAYHQAFDCGDVEWGAYALASYIQYRFFLAPRLDDLQRQLRDYLHQIRLSGQRQSEEYSLFTLQTIDNLLGRCTPATILEGEYYRESVMLEGHQRNNHRTAICLHYFYKGLLHYLFGEYDEANATCDTGMGYLGYIGGTFTAPYLIYLSALAKLANFPSRSLPRRATLRLEINRLLRKIERFAQFSPHNHKHHALLIRAELERVSGRHILAMSYYEGAIRAVEASQFVIDRALCHELTGRFYAGWGKRRLALASLQQAWTIYRDWGAITKCDQMSRTYNHDFSARQTHDPKPLRADTDPTSTGGSNHNLDIKSVLKAAHTIADEIVLEHILERLLSLAMESAGAQRCSLILQRDGRLLVAADTDTEGHQQIEPETPVVDSAPRLPLSLIHYVSRTRRTVVIDSTTEDELFLQDVYLRNKPPCSVLCLPILYHGELTGMLYLENNEARGVFTPERVDTLKVLAAQAAISIETAKLYLSLEQSEKEYRSLVENAVEGIFRVSPEGQFISVNPALVELLGYASQERFISTIDDIGRQCFHDRDDLKRMLGQLKGQSQVSGFECQWQRRNGEPVHVAISTRKVIGERGTLTYYEGTVTDISARKAREQAEQKRLEAELGRQKAEAQTAAKSQFLATMSHEIRTPMNGVLGMAQLLLQEELTEQQRARVNAIYDSGQGLLAILNNILDFSRLEAGRMEFSHAPFLLSETLNGVTALLTPLATEKGLHLDLTVEAGLPDRLLGDGKALHQVLMNLCSNAIKFTEYGTIGVRVFPLRQGNNELLLRFEVQDSGIGIPPQAEERIFRHFSQADSSITRHYGGTGLGLAICKNLVEQQGGEIGYQSSPGEGTLFWFRIGYQVDNHAATPQAGEQIHALPPRNILLVEDTPINQQVIAGLLEQDGHRVSIAGDGFAALALLDRNRYDLILMDIHLPGMDGMQTTRQIRQRSDTRQSGIPIIAITASVTDEEIQHYYRAGISSVVGKPILYSKLRRVLADTLSVPEARETALNTGDGPQHDGLLNQPLLLEHLSLLGPVRFGKLLETYHVQALQLLDDMEQALSRDERDEVRELAHKLVGASGNFGLERLGGALASLEATVNNEPAEALNRRLNEIHALYNETHQELTRVLAEQRIPSAHHEQPESIATGR